uniref:Uncharacterized protein n=1 Tax=Peronospora matthiolae TaxID=2874970 RepID=A0AAV1TMG5_9STRA
MTERDALRERYLTPQITTKQVYLARLNDQARNASVPAMRTVPVVLLPGESEQDDDDEFVRWVHHRQYGNMNTIRASGDEHHVRLERTLRFDFAKLKARGQLRSAYRYRQPPRTQTAMHSSSPAAAASGHHHSMTAADPTAFIPTGRNRLRSQDDHARSLQKRQRCIGSNDGGGSGTSTRFHGEGAPATSPQTNRANVDDVASEGVPRGSRSILAQRAGRVDANILAEANDGLRQIVDNLMHEVQHLRATLVESRTTTCLHSTALAQLRDQVDRFGSPGLIENRLRALDQGQSRLEGQLDVLLRVQHLSVGQLPSHWSTPEP